MDTSPSSSQIHCKNREKFFEQVISPAIKGKTCPICLKSLNSHLKTALIRPCLHSYCTKCIRKWSYFKRRCPLCNAPFQSFFCRFNFSSRHFLTENLPPLIQKTQSTPTREIRRESFRRSRALPLRRRFGRPGSSPDDFVARTKLRWRASVYRTGLRAVPLSSRHCMKQDMARDDCARERMRERIQPWIRRELQAVLDDPDPSVIVHVASSLYISRLAHVRCEDNFLDPLLPFLRGWTEMFWHELRCFAKSSLTMEAYDEVVTYKKWHQVY